MVCASADTPPAASAVPLTLAEAITRTLAHNPDLARFSFRLKAQDARIAQAGLKPAPELSLQLEDVLGSGRTRAFDGAQATLAMSQVVELGGLRSSRIAAAEAVVAGIDMDKAAAQLDALAEVTRRLIHVATDELFDGRLG